MWLGNNSLTSLAKSLPSLIHLTVLSAWGNTLKTNLVPEWGVWVNLTYLDLHTTHLLGNIPSTWGVNFTKLEKLSMHTNDLEGIVPSWIEEFQLVAADVDFTCNFLRGTIPASPKNSKWTGNCFDSDKHTHSKVCNDNRSCKESYGGGKDMKFIWGLVLDIFWGIFGLIGVLVVLRCLVWRCRSYSKRKHHRRLGNDQDIGEWEVPPGVRRFTSKEIMKATKSFNKDSEIGEGGFGKVYLAQLDDNKQVAIKRASDMSFQGIKEFRNEIMLLDRLHHRHLVQLDGFCDDKNEQILVYEYMKNGNLHHHLFDKGAAALNWYRRIEIALGVAQGLEYLHTFADPPVIHRDVKPSNILLDGNMIAKVADFGISKANPEMDTHISTRPAGTFGYLDPEYFLRRQLTTASDVYGYGVVLLELFTGQLAIDHKRTEDYNLVAWVNKKFNLNEDVSAIIDPRLGSKYPLDEYIEVIEIAIQCTRYDKNDRPKIQAVAASLEQILSRLQPPAEHMMPLPPPSPTSLPSNNGLDQTTNSLNDIKITYVSEVEPR